MDRLARYNFRDDHGHPLENCVEYRAIFSDHAAEVARLTGERDAYRQELDGMTKAFGGEPDGPSYDELLAERDAAEVAKERAEGALRFYAEDDQNAVECGILGNINDRPAAAYFATAQDAKLDHLPDAGKMVSDRERRLMNIIRGLVSHLELCRDMDFPGDTEEDKFILESVNAILGEARATLSPQRGGQKGEE